VELFLNAKSLGKKATNRETRFLAVWQVPYVNGELKAIGFDGKKQVATAKLISSGKASKIKLTSDRSIINADVQDLSYITVELTDDNGVRDPKAENIVSFEIEGRGTIIGIGNANPVSVESFQGGDRKAWHGRCMVIVKSDKAPGQITLKASSPGMLTQKIELETIGFKSSVHKH
jgi:beta-galactosidase